MLISEFDYDLPDDLIAQQPLAERDASRMLVLERKSATWSDSNFQHFPDHLQANDVVVVNNSRVIPARLSGRRAETGGAVEVFLVREVEQKIWEALVRPGGRLREGCRIVFGDGRLIGQMLDARGHELRRVRFECEGRFEDVLAELGSTPLPPYIKRSTGDSAADRERYQTVYSKSPGAIAAPTAGLHFTDDVLARVRAVASVAEVTLHVGYGTFEPVRVEDVDQHQVSSERFSISEEAAATINQARTTGGRVIVVGTTTMRALESSATADGRIAATSGEASLTIKPGYRFRIADALLTNFHLPRSSLLVLVSAFAGRELVLAAYGHAV
ncbi:MAG TPA: tRNA preQ1(34) S-adenosylmethionine ribosyltransferase-isomerase QueA, partial [Pyrinomonadaceae bacterium]|nr:tRNA preQ1(34) S-adenosylmethionine ribosyltransferase-isomerase QueA [Pyrinomonadaceae bacterium]